MTNWFISVNGDQKGPYPTDQLRQLLSDGIVPREAYVWREGMAQWQLLSEVILGDELRSVPASIAKPRDDPYAHSGRQEAAAYVSPRSGGNGASKAQSSGWMSFEGRIGRKGLWLRYLVPIYIIVAIFAGIDFAAYYHFLSTGAQSYTLVGVAGGISTLVLIACTLASLAGQVKRCHDHDRSGWFLLLSFVPLANIWLLVELYFVRGTIGPNRFGPDPAG